MDFEFVFMNFFLQGIENSKYRFEIIQLLGIITAEGKNKPV